MLDFVLDILDIFDPILDFFFIYDRDWDKAKEGWLYSFLYIALGVVTFLLCRAGGVIATLLAVITGIAAVVFFVKSCSHTIKCIAERHR